MVRVQLDNGNHDPNAPTIAAYEYDALGRRVQTTDYVDAVTGNWLTTPRKTRHIYAGPETIEEYDVTGQTSGQGTLLRQFLWGDAGRFPEPLAMVTHGGESGGQGGPGVPADQSVFHYLHDGLGSVVGLTDASGEIVERYTYDPYGKPFIERWDAAANDGAGGWETSGVGGTTIPAGGLCYSALGNPFTWTGQRYEAGTGLYGFLFRTYSPALGRWLQRDPIAYVKGVSLYAYALGSPLTWMDPLGLHPTMSHNWIIDGLDELSLHDRAILKDASSFADSVLAGCQAPERSPYHAMTGPGQTEEEAMKIANQFLSGNMTVVLKFLDEGRDVDDLLFTLGTDLHLLADATAPLHGWTLYDGSLWSTIMHVLYEPPATPFQRALALRMIRRRLEEFRLKACEHQGIAQKDCPPLNKLLDLLRKRAKYCRANKLAGAACPRLSDLIKDGKIKVNASPGETPLCGQ